MNTLTEQEQQASGRALAIVMSEISERIWLTGWDHELEYRLWAVLRFGNAYHPRQDVPARNRNPLKWFDIETLRLLSNLAGGWVVWGSDGEELMPIAEWERQFAAWLEQHG